jgi:hypothetical protein
VTSIPFVVSLSFFLVRSIQEALNANTKK